MIDEIRKNKPEGATHYSHRSGFYYKVINDLEVYIQEGNEWVYLFQADTGIPDHLINVLH